jgi:ERF superfamily
MNKDKEVEIGENPTEIQRNGQAALARTGGELTENEMMQAIIADPLTTDKAGALKELILLQEHRQDRAARVSFWQAFARVKANLKTIIATHPVTTKTGALMWTYATIQELQTAIEPILDREGLTLSFDTVREGPLLTGLCHVIHVETGHQETRQSTVNVASAPGEIKDMGAATMACRKALIMMFGLKISTDDDARDMGDTLRPEQIEELKALAATAGANVARFLSFAGVKDWPEIRQGDLPQLQEALRKKIAAANPPASNVPSPAEQEHIREQEAREEG